MRIAPILFVGVLALGCQQTPSGPSSGGDGSSKVAGHIDNRLVTANNDFGFRLLRNLVAADATANVFMSPSSVLLALGMTYNGAAGETEASMARTLGLEGISRDDVNAAVKELRALLADPDPQVTLAIANSLWGREGITFDSVFLADNREFYAAEIRMLDFGSSAAAPTINGWVDDNTRGKITEIVDDPIDPLTVLFLINAIYFKGTWTYQFDPSVTQNGPFFTGNGEEKAVPYMNQAGEYRYLRGDGFGALCLPYGDGRIGMYLFLPDPDLGLAGFVRELTTANWQEWMAQFAMKEGDLYLPRFRLEYEESLVKPLAELGMELAFGDGADFTAMTPPPHLPLAISNVKHKTFLEVNEEGTEAAAVTSVEVGVTSEPDRFWLRFNRPFFCAIRDDSTGVVLFAGTINTPE